ncbi:polysaccharide lyase family 8 super-sandwich domain-containing protein [Streptomyces sp. VRA16 Mangrove soil]|uniref:polysaccharide lyase family 8 super-sandwich domain-containing protein n=1 Tax=Streptomyces sp. VRA16 Mangrove soil TaxID=2817434 RepID=UPI001A9F8BAE|nr:polysaccharide lyase family 8 super-sandwich domain-containing protein [Streptomyces sp. VRA16 Mangrove soil]MBO1333614.1 silent information regulator protein Sir2 [Streptomyces sp. VRA16 Mangrove soil]
MDITRRRLLSVLAASGVLAAVPVGPAGAAETAEGVRRLLANTIAVFAGTEAANSRPETAAKVAAAERTARTNLAALDAASGEGTELFAGVPLGTSDPNLTTTYQRLYEIALATVTPGVSPDLYGSSAVRGRVVDGLQWLHTHYYGDQSQGYYGNWFSWEIGIPQHISRTLVLLGDQVPAPLVSAYVASMDAYLRNGKDGDVDLDSRFHTGANLADITTNRILQGAVTGGAPGEARIRKALTDQLTVFATVDPYALRHGVTDGYYADGSFIQHASVAYTGAYGKGLLTRVVQTLKILDGTGFVAADALLPTIHGWVRDGFAPLIFEGWMMEAVKGRSVSRTGTGYADVATVVEAVVDLASLSSGAEATALASYVKHLRASSRAALDPTTFVSPLSIVRYTAVLADASVPAADLNAPARSVAFNAMDRTVHRRPGYAFTLSRSSRRISKYEYMSGENLMPWFQGDGAHHLYLSGQDQTQAFGIDYFTTVSPYGLAGVTAPVEHRGTVPELYDGKLFYDNPSHPLNFTASSESQNRYVYFPTATQAYSGGAVLDGVYGAAGWVQSDDVPWRDRQAGILPDDFIAYRNARATKSWFLLDDEVVILSAGVGDAPGAGRAVTTTVDARIAAAGDAVSVTEGDGWTHWANTTQHVSVGYVRLAGPAPKVRLDTVTRSRRVVRTSNPDTAVTKQVFSVTVEQEAGSRPAAFAYVLLPHATPDAVRAAPRVQLLANTPRLQAVRHTSLGLTAANTFTSGTHHTAGLAVEGPASVLVRREGKKVTVAVSDPTTERDTVSVTLHGRALRRTDGDDAVHVRPVPGGTRLDVTTRHAYGRSFSCQLAE